MRILNDQACKATENISRIWAIEKMVDKLNVSLNHHEYGVTSHERINLAEQISVFRKRIEVILAEQIPEIE